ncbi:MAG: hypothetical protein EZS28_020124 [Streblomastix strix]|uniref:Uncharacterized protein n=1 Tax=Streblomastix strix TaxID=222440 RepID=A0A5J4VPT6_9EUKA|nr:MAG: hypothetical protein EZS28_020124 [Streblomastix strix]
MPLSRQHQNLKNINVVLPEPTAPTIQWFPLTRNKEFLVNERFLGAGAMIFGPSRSTASPNTAQYAESVSPSTKCSLSISKHLYMKLQMKFRYQYFALSSTKQATCKEVLHAHVSGFIYTAQTSSASFQSSIKVFDQ